MITFNKNWLDNSTVIVTGASGGMGAGIAKRLIQDHNCTVIGIARSEEKMKSVIADLGPAYADKFTYHLFDVSKKENWENLAKELDEKNIQPDILINNAGILPKFKRFDRFSDEEIERVMNINFYSCVYSIRALIPVIQKSSKAAIINIDSSAALMTLAGTSGYSASKAALKAFTEAVRTEYMGKVYVSLVCPGFTKTDIFRNQGEVEHDAGDAVINLVATSCDRMVNMIMRGIEHKVPMQVHGVDAHLMSVCDRLMPVLGNTVFSGFMKLANVNIFAHVFREDVSEEPAPIS